MSFILDAILVNTAPIPFMILGFFICFLGCKCETLYFFSAGAILAGFFAHSIIGSVTDQPLFPVISAVVIAAVSGIAAALMRQVTSGMVLGWCAALGVFLCCHSHNSVRVPALALCLLSGVFFAWHYQELALRISSACFGALLLVVSLDQYQDLSLTTILWEQAAFSSDFTPCSTYCFLGLALFVVLDLFGVLLQGVFHHHLSRQEQLLRERDNFLKKMKNELNVFSQRTAKEFSSKQKASLHPKAAFNYFPLESALPLDENLPFDSHSHNVTLKSLFVYVAIQFGFQEDNRDCQNEHLAMLLSSLRAQYGKEALNVLHNKIFSNYLQWCCHLKVEPLICRSSATKQFRLRMMEELCLFFLIWGESANLRHMPECLCYLFHQMSAELHPYDVNAPPKAPGFFLLSVVKPIFCILLNENQANLMNYDDINEFFWDKTCLNFQYYHEPTGRSIGTALLSHNKTFHECRSWLHITRTFFRVFGFLSFGLHLLCCLAFLDYYGIDARDPVWAQVMMSAVLSISVLCLLKECLDVFESYSRLSLCISYMETAVVLVKLAFKTCCFYVLTLNYLWVFDGSDPSSWHRFLILSALYASPILYTIVCQVFVIVPSYPWKLPAFLNLITELWYPSRRLYLGRNFPLLQKQVWKYQLFWVSLLIVKFTCSYQFEIQPLIEPTVTLLFESPQVLLFPASHIIPVVLLWVPFLLVYYLDIQIWFSVWAAVIGFGLGMTQKIGQVRGFTSVLQYLPHVVDVFTNKVMSSKSSGSTATAAHAPIENETIDGPKSIEDMSFKLGEIVLDSRPDAVKEYANIPFHSEKWKIFSRVWNEFIDELRQNDLLNNSERSILKFRYLLTSTDESELVPMFEDYHLPFFMTAGVLDDILRIGKNHGLAYRAQTVDRKTAEERFSSALAQPLIYEVGREILQQSLWLLGLLLGNRHSSDLQAVSNVLLAYVRAGSLITHFRVEQLHVIQHDLLNLIRTIRVAAGTFNERPQKNSIPKQSIQAQSLPSHLMSRSHLRSYPRSSQCLPRSPSVGTLFIIDKYNSINSSSRLSVHPVPYESIDRDVDMIREHLALLLGSVAKLMITDRSLVEVPLKNITNNPLSEGFFWDMDYARAHLNHLFGLPRCAVVTDSLYQLLTLTRLDTQPQSSEALRRVLFFVNSLCMDIPKASSVRQTRSWSILTPYYSEDCVYSNANLFQETEDGVSVLLYLQTIYPQEWAAFQERLGITDATSVLTSPHALACRLWATERGQTLFRTARGMMLHQRALRLLLELEEPSSCPSLLDDIVKQKFNYVIAAQCYSKQKKSLDVKANDTEFILHRFPQVRAAFIDQVKVSVPHRPTQDNTESQLSGELCEDTRGRTPQIVEDYYAVLIKSYQQTIQEVYRIKLPGNPIIGEGKPENQNNGIAFTRGECLQAIDMNQEHYFEECIKIKNLLAEFYKNDSNQEVAIVGFREHIFSGSLSSIANFMALQESTFVTLGQRVQHVPLMTRLHYGHPDIFDKLFFLPRGGISKASKKVNLSEDIFAGYNALLRNGAVKFKEYIQCGKGRDMGLQQLFLFEAKLAQGAAEQSLSRDVCRIAHMLDFFRLLSFYFGGIGFYISNCLTIWAIFLFLYSKVILTLVNMESMILFQGTQSMVYWFGQLGFLLTLPMGAALAVEVGFLHALWEILAMILSGGPLFFCFHMGTKAHYFHTTIARGGAKYRSTGRGFVTKHESFAEIYRGLAYSHFLPAAELLIYLIVFAIYTKQPEFYIQQMWPIWLLTLAWFFSPFWFNPMGFDWNKVTSDAVDWLRWMHREEGSGSISWKNWWQEEHAYVTVVSIRRRIMQGFLASRFVPIGLGLLYHRATPLSEVIVCLSIVAVCATADVVIKRNISNRAIRCIEVTGLLVFPVVFLVCHFGYGVSVVRILSSAATFLALFLILTSIVQICLAIGVQLRFIRPFSKPFAYVLGFALLAPVFLLSVLIIPALVQTRVMFNNAFSQGVLINDVLKGRRSNQNGSNSSRMVSLVTPQSNLSAIINERTALLSNTHKEPTDIQMLRHNREPKTLEPYSKKVSLQEVNQHEIKQSTSSRFLSPSLHYVSLPSDSVDESVCSTTPADDWSRGNTDSSPDDIQDLDLGAAAAKTTMAFPKTCTSSSSSGNSMTSLAFIRSTVGTILKAPHIHVKQGFNLDMETKPDCPDMAYGTFDDTIPDWKLYSDNSETNSEAV